MQAYKVSLSARIRETTTNNLLNLALVEINTWAELLNPEFKGKASILDISSIGIMDMAMVCEAMGEIQYGDKGNMTKEEIDKTIGIFTEAKKAGQFRAFWKSFDESVNLMASGEVVIQSMWSPAITAVRSKGIPCVYQPLKEGYRSWGGGLGIAAHLSGKELDAAYEYINWYLSGWVGGFLMRQGYYSAAVETSKEYMSADEWGYWFEGEAAKGDIVNPQGVKMESAGAVRDAVLSMTVWAVWPVGMLLWMKTSIWLGSGTNSSLLKEKRSTQIFASTNDSRASLLALINC